MMISSLTDRSKADSLYELCLDGRIVSLRFANQVVANNFYRQLTYFIQYGTDTEDGSTLEAEALEVSRSGSRSWIIL